ncbi:RNA polymerase-binding protein DksA [Sinimarinibacterium thermocellulolyticum]|uniref:RNA polymerase-binding protein DksA n=1 Tax=Sinimarinibacterium thermocellulolyticum TaxID=3170016 RepID=A0ABV2A8B5_9GAMM
MTTKKSAKSKPAATRQTGKTKSTGSSLLGRLKGALTKGVAAKTARKDAPKKPATKKTAKPRSAPKAKPEAKSAVEKSQSLKTRSVKSANRPTRGDAAAAAPHKTPDKTATNARSAKSGSADAPVSRAAHMTEDDNRKVRITSFDPSLTEDDIKRMPDDDYMNDVQLEFFRRRLLQMRQEVLQREMDVKERLHEREVFADPADRATAEEEHWLDLRLRERESLLLRKIDDALRRIEAKEYGYCEKTGDPIGIPRLLARPTATVCVDVKGQDERIEAQFRDR